MESTAKTCNTCMYGDESGEREPCLGCWGFNRWRPDVTRGGPRLIGLAGRARSGKSTVAGHLVGRMGYTELSFAAPIREFVRGLLGMTPVELEAAKELPVGWLDGTTTPRRMMQTLGTEWGRQCVHPELWVRSCMRRASALGAAPVVISDVRFDNEAEAVKLQGGEVWQIVRPDAMAVADHASEAGIRDDLIDRVVLNDGALADLHARVNGLLGLAA